MGGGADDGLAARGDGDEQQYGTLTAWRGVRPAPILPLRERLPLVFPLEALNAAGGIQKLLLAGKVGMALGAHLHPDLGLRRPGVNDLSAVAGDRRIDVLGMNASLHGPPPGWKRRVRRVKLYQRRWQNATNPALPTAGSNLAPLRRGMAAATGRAYPIWLMALRKSLLVLVNLTLSSKSSMASTGLSWVKALRRSQTFWSSSFSKRSSSLRVPVCSMLMVGKTRLSMRRRSRCTSMLPVPLNSSKITSSMREPVSMRAVAMMVSEPPPPRCGRRRRSAGGAATRWRRDRRRGPCPKT